LEHLAGPGAVAAHGDALAACPPGIEEDGFDMGGGGVGGQVHGLGHGCVHVALHGGLHPHVPPGRDLEGGHVGPLHVGRYRRVAPHRAGSSDLGEKALVEETPVAGHLLEGALHLDHDPAEDPAGVDHGEQRLDARCGAGDEGDRPHGAIEVSCALRRGGPPPRAKRLCQKRGNGPRSSASAADASRATRWMRSAILAAARVAAWLSYAMPRCASRSAKPMIPRPMRRVRTAAWRNAGCG
jgi:hypothetical protein